MADESSDPTDEVIARLLFERDERANQQAVNGARGNIIINRWGKLIGAMANEYNVKLQTLGVRFQGMETNFGPKDGEGTFVRLTIAKRGGHD